MNNQTTERIKESLVSSDPRGASGSDSYTVSTLSVRGSYSLDESDILSAVKIKDDSEFLAETSFAEDDDENIKDPCAVCFTNRNFPKKATHFCNDCGILGHFLCEQCLGFHKKFTKHKSVKSFASAKYKREGFQELKNENDKLKHRVSEAGIQIKDLQNKISLVNSEAEKQLKLNRQQVEQNANNKADKRSNHDEVLQQKATEIDELKEKVKELSRNLKEFEDIKIQLLIAKKSVKKKDKQIQEMIKEKTNIETEKNKLENKCESIREQLKIREGQLEGMKKNSSNSDESTKSQADEIKQKLKEINDLKNNLTEAQRKLRQSMEQIKAKEHEIKTLKDEHEQTIKKKDDKCVGANIMNDNPNMTDLSDENRPTKLSEKHCELYHNEWTDAYEEAENEFKTEEKGIAHLYKTLQDVSDFCKKKSVEHEENIRKSIMTLPNLPSARLKSAKIGAINQHQLKEVRKSFAPMLVESVFQNYVHEKKLNFTKKENTGKFIKKCVEICWLMNSQNPPVIFDTSDVNGKSFDVDKFRTYTKTGKLVDYVVWPPMLLHKGGPMLCKGVAQGK